MKSAIVYYSFGGATRAEAANIAKNSAFVRMVLPEAIIEAYTAEAE
ncbi:hypothetical protein SDC9_112593 [bioreactor metagenome]|uniref:Uncharacterized protein n=1 Tax=bioreactor metagenome TaxID=1076179 RepID=A0A645BKD3_9ZZZZ